MPEKIIDDWIAALNEVYQAMPSKPGVVIVKPSSEDLIEFAEVTQTMSMPNYIVKLMSAVEDEKPEGLAKNLLMFGPEQWQISFVVVEPPSEKSLNDAEFLERTKLGIEGKFKPYERGFDKAKAGEVLILDAASVLGIQDWYFVLKFLDYTSFDLGKYRIEKKSAVKMSAESGISRQTCGSLKTKFEGGISVDLTDSYAVIPIGFIQYLIKVAEENYKSLSERSNFCRLVLFLYTQIKRFGGFFSISMSTLGDFLGNSKNTLYKMMEAALNSNCIIRKFVGNGLQGIASGYIIGKSNH